jgi:hypothetical protein
LNLRRGRLLRFGANGAVKVRYPVRSGLALATSQRSGQHDTGPRYSLRRRFYRNPNTGTSSAGWKQALQAFTTYFEGRIPASVTATIGYADGRTLRRPGREVARPCARIARELPMEYTLELNRLIELQMEGAVG